MIKNYLFNIFLLISLFAQAKTEKEILRFNHLSVDNGLSQNSVHAITKDKYGFMWFGTWEGVCRFDGYEFKIFRADEENNKALTNNRINSIITDSIGNIWISTGDNRFIFRFNYKDETFSRFKKSEVDFAIQKKIASYNQSKKIAENKQFIWKATENGLIQINKTTGNEVHYQVNQNSPFAISDHVINVVYLDDSNNLWVGSQNAGINVANLNLKQFNYYSVANTGLSDNVIRAICQDKSGKLWIGTEANGITVVDRNYSPAICHYFGKDKLINPDIRYLYCDKLGNIWIGTKGGLDRYNPQNKTLRHYYAHKNGSINNPWVFWIMEDHNGCIWVGTFDGIAKYDRKLDRFYCYDPSSTLMNKNVRVITEDHQYNLWVATEGGGITRLKRDASTGFIEKLSPTHYIHNQKNSNSLINNIVLTMAEDENHKIWIGTNSGLCRLDPTTNQFLRFSVSNGFPDDLIMGLLTDGKGHIWISHKKGITCMDICTFSIRTYDRYDGLQGNEFTQNAYFRNSITGEMFFGGTNGLNSFYPDKISINPIKPHPVLTVLKIMNQTVEVGAKINNHIVLKKSILCSRNIKLTWKDANFSIGFSALTYDNPQGCKYKYILKGIDHQWIYTDASMREATYTHLPAGNYVFTVFASNSDGLWSEKPAMIKIEILPPWWLSWWAKTIYFIAITIVAWFIYRYIHSRVEFRNRLIIERLKNEKNEEVTNLKIQFFTEISHEFRTPLTLIIDPLEQLISGKPTEEQTQYYYQLMNRNAKQMLELVNQLLDFRKLQSNKFTLQFISTDLVAFIREVADAYENKASVQHIRFVVLTSVESLTVTFDADKMKIILNNLISNAFKFTLVYGEIMIQISEPIENTEMVSIEIKDNGIGISNEHQDKIFDPFYQIEGNELKNRGSGLGLALTKELVLLHHGSISLSSELGKGSCFKILIPKIQHTENSNIVEFDNLPIKNKDNQENNLQLSEISTNDKNILLLIDDNEDIRDYIRINFSSKYQIVTSNNGLKGFNKAVEILPDIIVSDIMMPGFDGIELCKRLKTDERTSHIPIILLTARNSDESKIEGYDTGADAYITKPFSKKLLSARIENLLNQRRNLRTLFSTKTPTEFKKITINISDENFLKKTVDSIEANLENPDFDPDILASILKMSRSQLYRKIKSLTNRTVHDFITSIKMNKAKEYLLSGKYSVSETAYKVGYSLPTNFTRTFSKQYGINPTKFLEKHKK